MLLTKEVASALQPGEHGTTFGGGPLVTHVAQHVCEKTIGASYGDAFLAALAIGAAKPKDILDWNPNASTVTPESVPAYATQYPLWKRLYAQTKDLMQALP